MELAITGKQSFTEDQKQSFFSWKDTDRVPVIFIVDPRLWQATKTQESKKMTFSAKVNLNTPFNYLLINARGLNVPEVGSDVTSKGEGSGDGVALNFETLPLDPIPDADGNWNFDAVLKLLPHTTSYGDAQDTWRLFAATAFQCVYMADRNLDAKALAFDIQIIFRGLDTAEPIIDEGPTPDSSIFEFLSPAFKSRFDKRYVVASGVTVLVRQHPKDCICEKCNNLETS